MNLKVKLMIDEWENELNTMKSYLPLEDQILVEIL